jgi:hypothetical protein
LVEPRSGESSVVHLHKYASLIRILCPSELAAVNLRIPVTLQGIHQHSQVNEF